jgi:hypothetical protein
MTAVLWVLVVLGFSTGLWLVWSWARQPDETPSANGDHDQL